MLFGLTKLYSSHVIADILSCNGCCSEFLYHIQLDVKNDPSDLLLSISGAPLDNSQPDIVSRLFEGQVVNLVCVK